MTTATGSTFTPPVLTEFQEQFLREWSEDLQTTDAQQGPSRLCRKSPDGSFVEFCCLGRAGQLLKDRHPDWLEDNGFRIVDLNEDRSDPDSDLLMTIQDLFADEGSIARRGKDDVLPVRLASLLGIGALRLDQRYFYEANDDRDRTFPEIGEAIDMALAGDYASAERLLVVVEESYDDES